MGADSYERLGAAAIQGETNTIPVPQQAFDLELLKEGEIHWATTDDDRIVISGDYDSLREEDGLNVFATSELTDGRTLHIPSEVFEEWDNVTGGDTLYFGRSDEMQAKSQCLVVPEAQAQDIGLLED